ncbi:hypothetical protein DMB66_54600 [Actinoplanes sp. ATCC 53533]|nr:hypothetical protein DMB66_54600 [Actinoplanes sp. ATCC 53533]
MLIALLVLVVVGAGGAAVWARGAPDADAEPTSAAVVTTPEPTTPPASDITDLAGSGSDSTGSGGLGVIPDETAPVEETPGRQPERRREHRRNR